jgi:hypothetical protein
MTLMSHIVEESKVTAEKRVPRSLLQVFKTSTSSPRPSGSELFPLDNLSRRSDFYTSKTSDWQPQGPRIVQNQLFTDSPTLNRTKSKWPPKFSILWLSLLFFELADSGLLSTNTLSLSCLRKLAPVWLPERLLLKCFPNRTPVLMPQPKIHPCNPRPAVLQALLRADQDVSHTHRTFHNPRPSTA